MATVESASESLARAAAARSATLAALVLELRKDPQEYLLSSEWGVGGLFGGAVARGARRGGAWRFLGRARGRRGRPRRDLRHAKTEPHGKKGVRSQLEARKTLLFLMR